MAENLVNFAEYLRANNVAAALPAVLDCLKAIPCIDLSDRDAFRVLLRANLVAGKEDISAFDRLFDRFWLPQPPGRPLPAAADGSQEEDQTAATGRQQGSEPRPDEDEQARHKKEVALRYSQDPGRFAEESLIVEFGRSPELAELIARLLASLANRTSRRYRFSVRGRTIDLRRILRKNIQFGGELILLDYRRRRSKRPRVVFLCDVSGSMDVHTLMMLQFVHSLKRIDRRTEIFFFATDLTRSSRRFSENEFSAAVKELPAVVAGWGGGTRIGHCLRRFNSAYGPRLLSRAAVVLIFSDGWDLGEADLLAAQMAWLKRRAHKVIWLNPLAGAKDYQPICQGMSAALPHVDVFLPMGNPGDLLRLGRTLETLLG
jgi:uncharacterized protein with von Willebrand factor type A (vWA) domain